MALRSLIPVEDIRVAHVNSEDNSTTYESGVAYKAGTLVTYEDAAYAAASDIAEDDTDLPNEAPLKWGLVPNAFTSGGDDSGLASRVSALESDVQPIPDMLNELGAKNLLQYPFKDTTQTVNGVTFTDNGDGTISANGTATAEAVFMLTDWNYDYANAIPLLAKYILNGNPSDFDFSTYFIQIIYVNLSNDKKWISPDSDDTIVEDKGDGYDRVGFRIVVKSGTTVDNVLFKPMLRYATINDNTYAPYAKTNRELTGIVNELLEVNVVTNPEDLTPYVRSIKENVSIQYFNISKNANTISVSGTVTNGTGIDIAANDPLFYLNEMPRMTLYELVSFVTSGNVARANLRDSGRVDLSSVLPTGESFSFAFTYITKELRT